MTEAIKKTHLKIHKIYLCDVSFETMDSFEASKKWKPRVDVEINTKSRKLKDKLFEVIVRVLITAKQEEKIAFLLEVQQAGIFTIDCPEKNQTHAVINAQCPNILFPFVREVVSDLVTKGGFPQLLLGAMNFEALYLQKADALREQQTTTLTTH